MKISSTYYDYYSQYYQINSLTNAQTSTANTNSSQNETEKKVTNSVSKARSLISGDSSIMNLNLTRRAQLRSSSENSSEMLQNMEKIKSDIDSIKTANIDNMSAADVKATLTKLQTDMASMPKPDEKTNTITQLDISTMSEADMKNILKKVQEHTSNMPVKDAKQKTEASDQLNKIKTDMESIKSADIDNLSADEMKTLLTTLKTDMDSIKSPYEKQNNAQKSDLTTMSETDMRAMLKKIQEQAKKSSEDKPMTDGFNSPPPPPPMFDDSTMDIDDTTLLNSNNETESV